MSDWAIRKMAIDVIYSMAAILKDALSPFKKDILEVLAHARCDKNKPVREAAIEAIQVVKTLEDIDENPGFNMLEKYEEENNSSGAD